MDHAHPNAAHAARPRDARARTLSTRSLATCAFALVAAVGATSCQLISQPLDDIPWAAVEEGTQTIGVSSGWALYEAEVKLTDRSGSPDLGTGSDTADLDPVAGFALKYQYFVHPRIALGAIIEQRTFDPDVIAPLESDIDGDDYTTYHYLLSSRFFSGPLGEDERWQAFGGLDLGFIEKVDLDATVTYAPGFIERVQLQGDSYWTLGAVAGLSYLIADRLSIEFGAFYEFALDTSDDTLTLNIPNGLGATVPNLVDGEVTPEGLIGFVTLTYYF